MSHNMIECRSRRYLLVCESNKDDLSPEYWGKILNDFANLITITVLHEEKSNQSCFLVSAGDEIWNPAFIFRLFTRPFPCPCESEV